MQFDKALDDGKTKAGAAVAAGNGITENFANANFIEL